MRILYFTRDYTPHDYRFLSSLALTDHQIFSLQLEQRGTKLEERPLPPEIKQVSWKGGKHPAHWQDGIGLLLNLKQVINQVRPDLIHAGPIQTSALLAASTGFRPLVSMSWGSDLLYEADRNPWWQWATRYTLRRTTVLVGDCQAVRTKAESLSFPKERIIIFPWGLDLMHYSPGKGDDLRARLGWQDAFILLSLRSWEPVYGVDVVIRAFIEASHTLPELRLILLGTGSQSDLLHRLVEENHLVERVFFNNHVSQKDLPQYYRAADLYLSASHSDGSSVSLMEALACGRPSLVSNIAGNREWVTDGKEGWLFSDGDASAMAEKICWIAINQSCLPKMGAAARDQAEKRADWSKNFQELLRAYEIARTESK